MRAARALVKPFTIGEAVAMLKSCVPSNEREWLAPVGPDNTS
jgi:hypothetical protein